MRVVLGPVVLWPCGGHRRLSRSWALWSPPPLPLLFEFLLFFFFAVSASVWPVARHFSSGVCSSVSGVSFPLALRWPCGRCEPLLFAGRLWAGRGGPPMSYWRAPWVSLLVLPGLVGCPPLVEWVRGFAVLRLYPPFSFLPVGRRVCDNGWMGLPPWCVFFPFWGGGCLFLPLPFLRWCMLWSAFGAASRVAVSVVGGCGPCPGCMGRVGYVHAWAAGLSCPVWRWFGRLGGCANRFREVMG